MKKENRLRKRKQFNWLFKNGHTIHSKGLVLIYIQNKTKNFKVGFSVTKKIGHAVVRNKVKRQLKAIVQKYTDQIINNCTMIFVAKPEILNETFDEMTVEVFGLLNKAKLLKSND